MNPISEQIQIQLGLKADEKKAKWLENYVKHQINSRGVGIPEIRQILLEANKTHMISDFAVSDQIEFLNDLMKSDYTEDKLSAILFIQLFWKSNLNTNKLMLISDWFDKGFINDWNVCDWLCVRILAPMVDTDPEMVIVELKKWNINENLWKARASLVPFTTCKSISQYIDLIEKLSQTLIMRDERFCKTAVGWVLREVSKFDLDFVMHFLEVNKEWVTVEVKKNALKYSLRNNRA